MKCDSVRLIVAAVIASAVVPTLIANAFYLPRHLLPDKEEELSAINSSGLATGETAE